MIKTQPLKQWEVGRELKRRIKNTFDQKGIEIPFPHISVYFGEASKQFVPVIIDPQNHGSILSYRGYELMKGIAEKRGKSVDELLKKALENIIKVKRVMYSERRRYSQDY